MNRREFEKGGLPGNWTEPEVQPGIQLSTSQRKDLNTLLKELDDLKREFNDLAEKKLKLNALLRFYYRLMPVE